MVSSNSIDQSSDEYCNYDVKCERVPMNYCQGCGQKYCIDHCLDHQRKLQEDFEHVIHTKELLWEKFKSLISQSSPDVILDFIKQIYEFKMKSNEFEETANIIQEQLQDLINEDKQDLKKKSITMRNGLKSEKNNYLENDIEHLRKDIEKLQVKFDEINNDYQKRASQEQSHIIDINVPSNNQSEMIKSPPLNPVSSKKECHCQYVVGTLIKNMSQKSDDISTLSHLLFKQISPTILDLNENDSVLTEPQNETNLDEDEEETIIIIGPNTTPKTSQKIRLSNNIIRLVQGPIKTMLDDIMHAINMRAQDIHTGDVIVEAVKRDLAEQDQIAMKQQTTKNSLKPAFGEITSDWKFEGENPDKGFSSPSFWMRNPQGQRIMVKIEDHPLCAANEWLAYILGRQLGLPVNEVQIAIYQNELVTLHTDVAHENEKSITFMDLPKKKRKLLLTEPIIECMDLFDHIIQNVDRNQRNIVITIPNTTNINDDTVKLKVYLIDHGACFGMDKLNAISIIASKFHYKHLSVIKFDPIDQARKFEQYLNKLPIADRPLISETLNRFAAISDDQFYSWMTEVQNLLSSSQYSRIYDVLRRQRDIAKRYTIQWGINYRSSSVESNETIVFF
ncbi:unnamed protein product [Rotaria sordida]|uniref:Uncharacterized protein n=1 Tax=Rotaria sordida TaxID=392033 RepID=A0A818QT79_9BILA|nr:unnamed protein product [Rotaria sordida]CAF3645756.1 unnamed protein product [Rotaria sordida]CAF4050062.1 unnamed protein product [Rotaria sordida]